MNEGTYLYCWFKCMFQYCKNTALDQESASTWTYYENYYHLCQQFALGVWKLLQTDKKI